METFLTICRKLKATNELNYTCFSINYYGRKTQAQVLREEKRGNYFVTANYNSYELDRLLKRKVAGGMECSEENINKLKDYYNILTQINIDLLWRNGFFLKNKVEYIGQINGKVAQWSKLKSRVIDSEQLIGQTNIFGGVNTKQINYKLF